MTNYSEADARFDAEALGRCPITGHEMSDCSHCRTHCHQCGRHEDHGHETWCDDADIAAEMARLGFEQYHTGGGCMAYAQFRPDGSETLVTIEDDAMMPDFLADTILVGHYEADRDHSEAFADATCSLHSFLSIGRTDR